MNDIAIQVEVLSKRYRLGQRDSYRTLRDGIARAAAAPLGWLAGGARRKTDGPLPAREHIWALKDVSFEVRRGEAIGIIGHNGSGKSTLLKILSRITEPTDGHALVSGRVGSLLEVGTGFNPELTGRENIFLNGSILGMRRSEILRKFDEIVAFAEVEQFIDTPIKRYSSGMHMRLAFSVAAHLEPDILIVDEVLAVGDAAFQKKCMGKMDEVAQRGCTVLFVSHNTAAIGSLCERVILLDHGRIKDQGPSQTILPIYLRSIAEQSSIPLDQRQDRSGDGSIVIVGLRIESLDADKVIRPSSRLRITLDYRSTQRLQNTNILVSISDDLYTGIYVLQSGLSTELPNSLPPTGSLICVTEPINIMPGRCFVHLEVMHGTVRADYIPFAAAFDIEAVDIDPRTVLPHDWACCLIDQHWALDGPDASEGQVCL